MDRLLPSHPDLAQLRRQAKELQKGRWAGDPDAITRFRAAHPRRGGLAAVDSDAAPVALSEAQLVLAREYGFTSWPRLKRHVEGLERVEERVDRLRQSFAAADAVWRPMPGAWPTPTRTASAASARARISCARRSAFHSTPLGWATHHGATEIFDLLRPHAGVHDAAQFGLLDRLKALLEADPALANARDALGQTPLHCLNATTPAAMHVVELLLACGADSGARDNTGQTPYEKARSTGQSELAERLRPRKPVATRNEEARC